MARTLKSDKVVFTTALLLLCVGVVMVYSASAPLAEHRYAEPTLFATKQVLWAVLGLAVLGVTSRVDYRRYRSDAFVWAVLGGVTALLVAVFFSEPVNEARRWLNLGGLGIQPSELAKLAVILFTALMLERRMHRIDDVAYSLPHIALVVGALAGLILFQPDFGTAVVLLLIAGTMVFAAGLHYRWVLGSMVVALPLLYLVGISESYRHRRVLAFLDPWSDPLGDGFQLVQSLIAVGTGGVTGLGLMRSVQKLFYLPEPHTDFIFAVIGEEFGLIGAGVIVICFGVIAWRGFRIATRAGDAFGAFLALGITTMIAVQALVNMSVALGLVPTKGIPLPFVSAGGSSLLVSLFGIGVLLNVSQHQGGYGADPASDGFHA